MSEREIASLTDGVRYDAGKLRLAGWIDPDGPRSDTPHLDHNAYIDDDGTYLGPDDEGVEPVFEAVSVVRLDPDPVAEIEAVLVARSGLYDSCAINTGDMAEAWHMLEFSAPVVEQWQRVGIWWPQDADALRQAKITPQQVSAASDALLAETGHYVSLGAVSERDITLERLIEIASNLPAE